MFIWAWHSWAPAYLIIRSYFIFLRITLICRLILCSQPQKYLVWLGNKLHYKSGSLKFEAFFSESWKGILNSSKLLWNHVYYHLSCIPLQFHEINSTLLNHFFISTCIFKHFIVHQIHDLSTWPNTTTCIFYNIKIDTAQLNLNSSWSV